MYKLTIFSLRIYIFLKEFKKKPAIFAGVRYFEKQEKEILFSG